MSRYSGSWPCGHDGCTERGHFAYDTRREQRESYARLHKEGWYCTRHRAPDEVLGADNVAIETVLESYETDFGYGGETHRFWAEPRATKGGNGFLHGPGFKAFSKDFPTGTRVIVTARVEVPALEEREPPLASDDQREPGQ